MYAHASLPALTIEVADSSLAFDPAPDAAAGYGWSYRSIVALAPDDVAIPLALPAVRLRVADLMP